MTELEKVKKIHKESQAVGEFLDWLNTKYYICREATENDEGQHFMPLSKSTEQLLAEYYKIDLEKLEKEKMQVLENFRKQNRKQNKGETNEKRNQN